MTQPGGPRPWSRAHYGVVATTGSRLCARLMPGGRMKADFIEDGLGLDGMRSAALLATTGDQEGVTDLIHLFAPDRAYEPPQLALADREEMAQIDA